MNSNLIIGMIKEESLYFTRPLAIYRVISCVIKKKDTYGLESMVSYSVKSSSLV